MQVIFDIYNFIFFGPIVNLLVFIFRVLEAAHIPGALGLSIIVLTILIRLALWPLMNTQLKSAKKMADLKPHLDQLKTKHKDDKQALAKAQMDLYKEHGVNPAGGCLPTLLQIPIIIALYQAILALFEGAHGLDRINHLLYSSSWKLTEAPDLNFLGFNLAVKPSDFGHVGLVVLLIPIITGLLQFVQSKMMVPPSPVKEYPSDSPKEKKEKEGLEDAMSSMQTQMTYLMPIMIAYFAFTFPIGIALYWNTMTVFGIIQQYKIGGWGGMSSLLSRLTRSKI